MSEEPLYTSRVDTHPGNIPRIVGMGALAERCAVFLNHEENLEHDTSRLNFSLMTWHGDEALDRGYQGS